MTLPDRSALLADREALRDRLGDALISTEQVAARDAMHSRPHGRRSIVGRLRTDEQYWFGRRHGVQVTRRPGGTVVASFELGQQLKLEIFDADGKLKEERVFHDGVLERRHEREAPPPSPPATPWGDRFVGRDTESLEVAGSTRWQQPGDVPEPWPGLLVERFGAHADEPTLAGVFALTDDGALTCHDCRVKAHDGQVQIALTHFGDTVVGLVLADDRVVATVEDGEIRPRPRGGG